MNADDYIQVHSEYLPISTYFLGNLKEILQNLLGSGKLDFDAVPQSSNFNSFVFVGHRKAYQVFVNPDVVDRMREMINDIPKSIRLNIHKIIGIGRRATTAYNFNIEYDVARYIPFTNRSSKKGKFPLLIEWQIILPLNKLQNIKQKILDNYPKFCWDINKALYALHSAGYVHGDARIDNIGINQYGNFCLYDFDMSYKYSNTTFDFGKLDVSLRDYGIRLPFPRGLNMMVNILYDRQGDRNISGEDIVLELENLAII
jgi:serine/threonine protein kinase